MPNAVDHRASPRETQVIDNIYVQIMEWKGFPITRADFSRSARGEP